MTPGTDADDLLMARIAERQRLHTGLSPLGAAILAALDGDLASDSRAIAKTFDVEHALVLREISGLESEGLLTVIQRDPRTMRARIALPS